MSAANKYPAPHASGSAPPHALRQGSSPQQSWGGLPASGPAQPHAGKPLAAYRSALAKVEPGDAFLARTRQALAEAGGPSDETAARLRSSPAARPSARVLPPALLGGPLRLRLGTAARLRLGTAARLRLGTAARLRLGTAARLRLGTAVCLALILLALPAGRLLGGGGASLSGGAASQAADEQLVMSSAAVAEDTAAAETAPAGDPSAPREAAPMPDAGGALPADQDGVPDSDRYSGGGAGWETGGAPPADGGTDGGETSGETHKEPGEEAAPTDAEAAAPSRTAPPEGEGGMGGIGADSLPPGPRKLPAGRNTAAANTHAAA